MLPICTYKSPLEKGKDYVFPCLYKNVLFLVKGRICGFGEGLMGYMIYGTPYLYEDYKGPERDHYGNKTFWEKAARNGQLHLHYSLYKDMEKLLLQTK